MTTSRYKMDLTYTSNLIGQVFQHPYSGEYWKVIATGDSMWKRGIAFKAQNSLTKKN